VACKSRTPVIEIKWRETDDMFSDLASSLALLHTEVHSPHLPANQLQANISQILEILMYSWGEREE
jgi:hypothetical protein